MEPTSVINSVFITPPLWNNKSSKWIPFGGNDLLITTTSQSLNIYKVCTASTTISSSSPSPHVNIDTTSLEMITPKQSWTVSPSSSIHYHSHVNIIPHDHHLGIGIENDIDIIKTSNKTTNYDIDGQVSSPKTITCTPDGHICNSPVALGKMLHQTSTSSILTAPSLHEHHDSDDYIDPKHTLWNVRKGSHRTMHYHHKLHQKKGCYA